MLQTPVLFLIFNRPDLTQKVFDAIRQARPCFLYVAADGPRENIEGEAEKCMLARQIIGQVDWNCEVKTLFREKNLGCKVAVSSAIDWFFEQVEEGIILEDDTLPNRSFFDFCSQTLEYYRNCPSIMHISGDNFQSGIKRGKASYYFSAVSHIWGWATWKRAWHLYDKDMQAFESFKKSNTIKKIFNNAIVQKYWIHIFDQAYKGSIDTWDIQWAFSCMLNGGLCVMPNVNLISNIGFRADGTHTQVKGSPFANMPVGDLKNISHPNYIKVDKKADLHTAKNHYGLKFSNKLILQTTVVKYSKFIIEQAKKIVRTIYCC